MAHSNAGSPSETELGSFPKDQLSLLELNLEASMQKLEAKLDRMMEKRYVESRERSPSISPIVSGKFGSDAWRSRNDEQTSYFV